jgi:hypothetical protein
VWVSDRHANAGAKDCQGAGGEERLREIDSLALDSFLDHEQPAIESLLCMQTLFRNCNRLSMQGQGNAEGSPAPAGARAGPAPNPAAMSLDDCFGDPQPEPCSALPFCTEERFEDLAPYCGRYSASVIREKDMRLYICAFGRNLQGTFDG